MDTKRSGRYVNGRRDGGLDDCEDVDLGATPVTNTLPIKRARPRVGSILRLTAAWVAFPAMEIGPLQQSCEGIGRRLYVYRSASGFSSRIEVDRFGFVRRYGECWRAVQRTLHRLEVESGGVDAIP